MRAFYVIAFGLLLILGAGCGGEDKPAAKPAASASKPAQKKPAAAQQSAKPQTAQAQINAAEKMPCSLFKKEELEQLLGAPVRAIHYKPENISESGYDWKAESCFWEQEVGGLTLKVSLGKHFFGKAVECYELTGKPKELKVNGQPGWWKFFNSVGRGSLRVCDTSKALVQVQLEQEGGEENALETKAVDIVKKTLERVKKG